MDSIMELISRTEKAKILVSSLRHQYSPETIIELYKTIELMDAMAAERKAIEIQQWFKDGKSVIYSN